MHYISVMNDIRKTPLSELYKDERYFGCHLLNSEQAMEQKLRAEAEQGVSPLDRPIFTRKVVFIQTQNTVSKLWIKLRHFLVHFCANKPSYGQNLRGY